MNVDEPSSERQSTPALRQARARLGAVLHGKWRLERLLGLGGMGAVYEARHRNGRRAAIKVLLPLHGADRKIIQRFLKEGYVANELGHPGAVEIFDDDFTEDGMPFLVMELLEGRSLQALLESPPGRLSVDEATRIGTVVLEVLAAAHERGIVHRDVKPDNVFLLDDGRVKLLDFGIARLRNMASTGGTTAQGAVLGTPAYMPPEQARGRTDELDARADVFAVGATLFTALSGRPVRDAPTLNEILLLAMTAPATPLAEVAPDVPPAVAAVVDRALAFAREDRWPTALAMRDELVRASAGTASTQPRIPARSEVTSTPPPALSGGAPTGPASTGASEAPLPARPKAPVAHPRRRRVLLPAAAGLLFATGLGAASVLRSRASAPPEGPTVPAAELLAASAPPPPTTTPAREPEPLSAHSAPVGTPSPRPTARPPSPGSTARRPAVSEPTAGEARDAASPPVAVPPEAGPPDPLKRRL